MATVTTEAAVDGADAAAAAPGMPQLNFDHWGNQIFWLLITLAVIYFVLSRVALPRIAAVLAERQGTITNDLAKAEELKRQAGEAEQAYDKALADARAEAQTIIAEAKAEISADLKVATDKADAEIAARTAESEEAIAEIRASALDNVKEVARDTAEALVTALGGRADNAAIDAAVAERTKG
ncbi:F0F1 ATP synthase subunit B' [Marinovum sp.]|uniref:F0F1 ATP synthase subunit B' n=1 Tax=Marinovum sp. TaxID=2024839 RepID=UPI002B267B3E|nr:F0F1 ATP synthase subunit B' [Marinovum sp.]